MTGHEGHWGCVYEDVGWFLREHLPEVYRRLVDEGEAALEAAGPSPSPAGLPLVGHFDRRGEIRHLMIHLVDHGKKTLRFVTAYPYNTVGVTHQIRVTQVIGRANEAEGQIKGVTRGGAFIAFFDPLYFLNKGCYQVGKSYDFNLSALAYHARPVAGRYIEVPVTEQIRRLLGEENPPPGPTVQVSTSGLAALLPYESRDVDDFAFQAPVGRPHRFRFEGRPVHRLPATVMRPEDEDFQVMLYIADHVFPPGVEPKEGDDLTGVLWMQGYLAGPPAH
ncbi:MAG: hypothetical protein AB1896_09790 [Thermodesulfobacteriota bacterium]